MKLFSLVLKNVGLLSLVIAQAVCFGPSFATCPCSFSLFQLTRSKSCSIIRTQRNDLECSVICVCVC